MRSVRSKLLLVVMACMGPAFLVTTVRSRQVERELKEEARQRMDLVDEAFVGSLRETLSGMELAANLATANNRLIRDLRQGDVEDAKKKIHDLGRRAGAAAFALVDGDGTLIASSDGSGGDAALSSDDFVDLSDEWPAQPVRTFVPVTLGRQRLFSLVVSEPILDRDETVGAILLLKPVDSGFLTKAGSLRCEWVMKVNGEEIAQSPGRAASALEATPDRPAEVVPFDGTEYAVNSFKPAVLQRPGQQVVVTATEDLSPLRQRVWGSFFSIIFWLALALLGAVALALWIGGGIAGSIQKISRAARGLREGEYRQVGEIRGRDELKDLADAFNEAVAGLKERDQLKETFGKYVTRQVAEQILRGKAVLGGETVPVTVLFSDIRGFTSLSERMEPKALLDFLNVYFTEMVQAVMDHAGVVDKFIGDAIMAVFGAPIPQPGDALRAVRAAVEMRTRLDALNRGFAARGLPEIRIGIGIHSGTVVAGNMGHQERMEYTVIGDSVNLASRLESLTKELHTDILVSEDTYLKVREHVLAEPLERIRVRGRMQEVLVYRLVGLKPQREEAPQAA